MIKIQVKIVLVCMAILFAYTFFLPGQAWGVSGEEVEIKADILEYDPATGIINALGNVEFRRKDIVITTNQLLYCQEDGIVRTDEAVHYRSATMDLTGEGMWYSLTTEEGEIREVDGEGNKVYFSGRQGEIDGEDILVRDGSYTRCELSDPCFSISAKKVKINGDHVRTGFGWLKLKGFKVLPLPPLSFSTGDDWPDLEVGYTNERGLFVGIKEERPLSESFRFNYGGSIGTNKWLSVDAGVAWQSGKLSMNTTGSYRWNGDHIFHTVWKYSDSWGQLTASYYEEWGAEPENIRLLEASRPLFAKTSGTLFYQVEQWGEAESYGARVSGRWIPGFTIGLGMVHGQGKLEKARLGWHPETSVTWSQKLTNTWSIAANATYLWGEGMVAKEGIWRSQSIALTKDLHCFAIGLNYDFIEGDYGYTLRIKW